LKEKGHQSIIVLTGAGISRESGLDTFRDKDGIWSKVSIDDVATPRAFTPGGATYSARLFSRTPRILRWPDWNNFGLET
jgi:NAD-dependent SIR2 family protein deacetylase